jgi:hypothetical protein
MILILLFFSSMAARSWPWLSVLFTIYPALKSVREEELCGFRFSSLPMGNDRIL